MKTSRTVQTVRFTSVALAIHLACATELTSADEPRTNDRNSTAASQVGFEEANPGSFKKLESDIGTWTVNVGRALIDNAHAKTGKHCLQLTGGEATVVTLQIADGTQNSGVLSFWAERWTARKPFSFRVEKNSGKGWQEIYNGDAHVRVGRAFLNHVKIPLADDGIEQLRFTCRSPPNTGILIDDMRIDPPVPMRVVSVTSRKLALPVLVRNEVNPFSVVQIEVAGTMEPLTLTNINAIQSARGKAEGALTVDVWATGTDRQFPSGDIESMQHRASLFDSEQSVRMQFTGECKLESGMNHFFLSVRSPKIVDLTQTFDLLPGNVVIDGKDYPFDKNIQPNTRYGYAVRKGGDDGVHTYRIPGLATTNQGTLIGVYDVRRRGGGDLPGDIDVGMSRSTDGGQSWEPMRVIMDMGDDPKWRYDGIGDPAVLVDHGTGTIWVAATWSHGNRSWRGSGPGLQPTETGQLMLVRSDDDGVTWSQPINITNQVKHPEWCFILQGPGKGITMRDGTIVFAAQYQDPPERRRLPHSTIIYSKDHGKTWHVGTGAFDDTTESQVVEIEPGVLMLNCRYNRKSTRVVMTTRDMGQTWQKHPTSERALIEPRACMASLIDVNQEIGKAGDGWLLFSNPDSLNGRNHITIKASPDRGQTWPKEQRLLLDEGNSAGYSFMSMIDDKTIGILYEGSRAHMTFQRIPLHHIIGNE